MRALVAGLITYIGIMVIGLNVADISWLSGMPKFVTYVVMFALMAILLAVE